MFSVNENLSKTTHAFRILSVSSTLAINRHKPHQQKIQREALNEHAYIRRDILKHYQINANLSDRVYMRKRTVQVLYYAITQAERMKIIIVYICLSFERATEDILIHCLRLFF